MSCEVQGMWEALYVKALNRSIMLESTKARYAKITVEEIDEFVKIIAEIAQRFEDQGPGSVGQDLDSGLKLMDVRHLFTFRKKITYRYSLKPKFHHFALSFFHLDVSSPALLDVCATVHHV